MSIVRVNKSEKYFTASNEPFNDKRLHWETRGLLAYLLSKPNQWQVRLADLENQGPAKTTKIRKMLKDAQKHGYMNRVRVVRENGTFYWVTEIYESPSLNPNPQSSGRFSTSGLSTSGKPDDIVITELVNTEIQEEEATDPKNIYLLYSEEIGVITPSIADALKDWENDVPEKWIKDAILEASANGARNWKYVQAILKRWHEQGHQGENKPTKKKGKKSQSSNPLVPVELSEQELEELRKYAEQEMSA